MPYFFRAIRASRATFLVGLILLGSGAVTGVRAGELNLTSDRSLSDTSSDKSSDSLKKDDPLVDNSKEFTPSLPKDTASSLTASQGAFEIKKMKYGVTRVLAVSRIRTQFISRVSGRETGSSLEVISEMEE